MITFMDQQCQGSFISEIGIYTVLKTMGSFTSKTITSMALKSLGNFISEMDIFTDHRTNYPGWLVRSFKFLDV